MRFVNLSSRNIADPPKRPAPLLGQHTVEICTELLGIAATEVSALIERGILQIPTTDESR